MAKQGRTMGRWSETMLEVAVALAPKTSAAIDHVEWAEWLDELSEELERDSGVYPASSRGGLTA